MNMEHFGRERLRVLKQHLADVTDRVERLSDGNAPPAEWLKLIVEMRVFSLRLRIEELEDWAASLPPAMPS